MKRRILKLISSATAIFGFLSAHDQSLARTLTWNSTAAAPYSSGGHWLYNSASTNPTIGDALTIGPGLGIADYIGATAATNMTLSSSSGDGQSLSVQGTLQTNWVQGGNSGGSGLFVDTGGSLITSGGGTINLAGEFAVGVSSGSVCIANLGGTGSMSVDIAINTGTDPSIYCGLFGYGTIDQYSGFTVSTFNCNIAIETNSTGVYNLEDGALNVANEASVGAATGGRGTLYISGGVMTAPTLKVWNTANSSLILTNGTLNTGTLDLSGNPANFNWSGGTLNLTNSSLTVGSGQLLGANITLNGGQSLGVSGALSLASGSVTLASGSTLTTGSAELGTSGSGNNLTVQINATWTNIDYIDVGPYSQGSLTITGGQVSSGFNNALTIFPQGVLNLSGGSLSTGTLNRNSGGIFFWNYGTLNLTNTSETIGPGNLFTSSTTLLSGMTLNVSQGVTIASGSSLVVNGGSLVASPLAVTGTLNFSSGSVTTSLLSVPASGAFAWTGGTLNITNASIAVGGNVLGSNAAKSWGWNDYGQLGNGTTASSSTPVAVTGLTSGVTSVAAGFAHSLAVQNGAVYAWGNNSQGQLGNGTTLGSTTPVAVTGLTIGVNAVAAGEYHGLALQNSGIYAWGYNVYGQLGNGTNTNSATPVAVIGLTSGVSAIVAGAYHSMALQNGAVYAWGYNSNGQLGNGGTVSSNTPTAITNLSSGVTAIATGYAHSLAIMNGGLYAWGADDYGQIGNGTTITGSSSPYGVLSPVPVTNLSTGVTSVAAGSYYSLAVQNGDVYAWGYNHKGELGNGTTTNSSTPQLIDPADLNNITSVAASADSSYALSSDGSLWVWGDNSYGELGLGSSTSVYSTPQHLLPPAGYSYTSVSGNVIGSHALATLAPVISSSIGQSLTLITGQTLNITGTGQSLNVTGNLNLAGGTINTPALTLASPSQLNWTSGTLNLTNSSLTVGGGGLLGSSLTVNAGQTLLISGASQSLNISGALNVSGGLYATTISQTSGTFINSGTLTLAAGGGNASTLSFNGGTLATGGLRVLAGGNLNWSGGTLKITNSSLNVYSDTLGLNPVQAWGNNYYGQLGNGTTANSSTPVAVTGFSSGIAVAAAGAFHSLAVQNGALYAWGDNRYGQFGNGTPDYGSQTPVAVTGFGSGVTAVAAGYLHSLAIQNHFLFAWGDDGKGQLGNGTTVSNSTPERVNGLNGQVSAVAAGAYFSLALENGGLFAWGDNRFGQLGYYTRNGNGFGQNGNGLGYSTTSIVVTGLSSNVTAISAGAYHSLAVQNGRVYAWGFNYDNELGYYTSNGYSQTAMKVQVSGLVSGVTAVAAGAQHSLALQNGEVYAWGSNGYGQLGNGRTNAVGPIDPADLNSITAIAAGAYSSYALASDGTLWVWGDNRDGELGLGTTGGDYSIPKHLLPPPGYIYTSISSDNYDDYNGAHAVATLGWANSSIGSTLSLTPGQTLQITPAGQSLNLTGTVNVSGGLLNVPTINQYSGNFKDTSFLTLGSVGSNSAVYNLSGGTLSTPGVSIASGGIFNVGPNTSVGIFAQNLSGIAMTAGSTPYGQLNLLAASNSSARQLLIASGFSIAGSANAWQGRVDLANNDLDVPGGSLLSITSQIQEGYAGGNWNGTAGILSSSAAADTAHLTALGSIQNNQSGSALFTASNPFDGITPGAGDILVKFTYYGDANLDGKVDGSDYSLIDNGYLQDLTGWFNGDFNYDGVVNGSDYTLIDNAFNMQGASLADSIASPGAIVTAEIAENSSSVPEPAATGLLSLAVLGTLGRRRLSRSAALSVPRTA